MRAIALLGPNADEDDVAPFAASARIAIPVVNSVKPADVVLILGGDGTVHRYLPALLQAQIPALIVPKGSGNDFARALGLKTKDRAVAAWRSFCLGQAGGSRSHQTSVRAIDVGEIAVPGKPGTHTFCCVAGVGIDADVNRRANNLPRWLRANGGYALSVIGGALNFRPQRITVEFEDDSGTAATLSEPGLMCAFANANTYGHGMRIAPTARLDDGLLELIFVREASAVRLLTVFPKVYFGAHMGIREVEHRRVRRLRISSETPLDIYADGEFICRTPAEVSVKPRALKVIS